MSKHQLADYTNDKVCEFFQYAKDNSDLISITINGNYIILNYKDICNHKPACDWSHELINMRGTILHIHKNDSDECTYTVVGFAPSKFWSYHNDRPRETSKTINVLCTEKIDGSFLTAIFHNNKFHCSTRNSFDNLQTKLFKTWFTSECIDIFKNLYNGWTISFELVHPDDPKVEFNRKFGIFTIWAVDEKGFIIPFEQLETIANSFNNEMIKSVKYTKLDDISIDKFNELVKQHQPPSSLWDLKEGYVWINQTDNYMQKSKNEHYLIKANGLQYQDKLVKLNSPSCQYYKNELQKGWNPKFKLTSDTSINLKDFREFLEKKLGKSYINSFYEIWGSYAIQSNTKMQKLKNECKKKYNELINENTENTKKVIGMNKKKINNYLFKLLIFIANEQIRNKTINVDNFINTDDNFSNEIRRTICYNWDSIN